MSNDFTRVVVHSQAAGVAKIGVGFGTALAISISWSINKSILWAIAHGLLSWIYVIYYAINAHKP